MRAARYPAEASLTREESGEPAQAGGSRLNGGAVVTKAERLRSSIRVS
jgi:hypothetical protein